MAFDYKFSSVLTGFRKSSGSKEDFSMAKLKALDVKGKDADGLLRAAEAMKGLNVSALNTTSTNLGALKPIDPSTLARMDSNASFVLTHLNLEGK